MGNANGADPFLSSTSDIQNEMGVLSSDFFTDEDRCFSDLSVRLLPETRVAVVVEDDLRSFRWQKYGTSKGGDNPTDYYKCAHPGCAMKKRVKQNPPSVAWVGEHSHAPPKQNKASVQQQWQFVDVVLRESSPRLDRSILTLVVEMTVNVDFSRDGFAWIKYGQKKVTHNRISRGYYRCHDRGCNVRKRVDRIDDAIVVVTYNGIHNHEAPFGQN